MPSPKSSSNVLRYAKCLSGFAYVAIALLSAGSLSAQLVKAEAPVRVRAWVDGGTRMIEGRLREYSPELLYVRVRRSDIAVPRDDITKLETSRSIGNQGLKGFFVGGAIGAAIGFPFGYCFQIFADGCAEDTGAGLQTAFAVGLVTGGIGFLLGRRSPRWGPYQDETAEGIHFQFLSNQGVGFSIALRH